MKIIFIKKPYNSQPDGGDIYNKKIIEGLSRIKDLTVDEYDIKIYNKGLLPFWRWRISKNELINLLKIEKKYDKVIISHESLASLTRYIKCDIFIFQNLYSKIRGNLYLYQALYKFGAKYYENIALKNSNNSIVLSIREYNSISKNNVFYIPPAINPIIKTEKNNNVINISSSNKWKLKKKSNLSLKEINYISKYFKIKYESGFTKVGLMEDRFDCGFKLRLIQMIYNCDLIITKLDFNQEILALNCSLKNIHVFPNFTKINFKKLISSIDHNANKKNRLILKNKHTWKNRSEMLYKLLNDE